MKITAVEPILVALPYEHGAPKPVHLSTAYRSTIDILFVRVETDAGVTGWGEAFSNASSPVTIPAITRIVAPLAVGRDPSDILALMTDLGRRIQSMSRGGPVAFALSGLDIALWDIKGKVAGQPVWRLLGGSGAKKRVPAYASLMRLVKPELVDRVVGIALDRGYRHIKLHEHSVEAVAAARKRMGPGLPLMVDTNCYWTDPEECLEVARRMAPDDVHWLEEPLYPPHDFEGMARLRRDGPLPIAAGENLSHVADVRHIIDAGGVDFIQPSVAKLGGITEMLKAIAYAESKGVSAVPHSPYVGPALIATLHVIAAMEKEVVCEHRNADLAASPLGDAALADDGYLSIPQAPGLGIEIDLKTVEKYRAG